MTTTLAGDRWPRFRPAPEPVAGRRHGVAVVWRLELAKCVRLTRVRVVLAACGLAPFLVAAVLRVQGAVPADTLFGQWLHESGFALPMVVLGFCGQWVLPLLTAIVAGDVFSSEDQFGTWKTVLTRSRSRGDLFAGKLLAAITYSVAVLVLLAGTSLLAGLLLGTDPVIGLTGQLVPSGRAAGLVAVSWASTLPPLLGFCALAVLLSILARSSVIGIGGPVLLGLVMQVTTLIDLPTAVRNTLLGTPFAAWHGFWAQRPFRGPFWSGLITSTAWFAISVLAAWLVFRRRDVSVS